MKLGDNIVARQYEQWAYPAPIGDMAEAVGKGFVQLSDPALVGRLYWPRRSSFENLDILVAGCGTHQAAYFAYRHPTCRVLGLDLSQASLAHQKYLAEKHGLANLELVQMDLLDVAALNRRFDLIVSTGVLHHLPDPDAGLRALGSVLAPDGVMSLMVYGSTLRHGVYLLQEAFRLLGLGQTAQDVQVVKSVIAALPRTHGVHAYIAASPDLASDEGIVDTFLHTTDRAYTVPQLLDFVRGNGLVFQGWLDPLAYSLDLFLADNHPVRPLLGALDAERKAQLSELLTASQGVHRFIACHSERPVENYRIQFDDDEFLSYVPGFRRGLGVTQTSDPATGRPAKVKRMAHEVDLSHSLALVMEQVNGKRPIREMLDVMYRQGATPEQAKTAARTLFRKMHEWGHLIYGY